MADKVKLVVKVEITRDASRPEVIGWSATLDALRTKADVAEVATDMCRRLRDDIQEALQ